MARFRKKPVVIEATQWFMNGDHPADGPDPSRAEGELVRYYHDPAIKMDMACILCGATFYVHGWIDTLEGGHRVCVGDWIITGIQGEHYPCKPDIFADTYEPVTE